MMPGFVLAHVSDLHIPSLPRIGVRDLLGKRALGYTNWVRKRHRMHRTELLERIVEDVARSAPDHIAVTGDLINLSLPNEYAPARAWLERLGSPNNVTLVPGNHDAYVRAAAAWPQLHWGVYMQGDAGEQTFPFVRQRGPLALIGLSSATVTPPFWATGFLGTAQLQRLGETLTQLGRYGLFRAVLVHHPPRSKPSRYLKRLLDGPALRKVLAEHGAELVIHGHDHVHSLDWIEGPRGRIPIVGVASASHVLTPGGSAPAGYNLYRIGAKGRGWSCEALSRSLAADGTIVETAKAILPGR